MSIAELVHQAEELPEAEQQTASNFIAFLHTNTNVTGLISTIFIPSTK